METGKMRETNSGMSVSGAGGFTLIEILIVVIILGVLAIISIPQFSNATMQSRESMLRENLRVMKLQIGTYRAQHRDVSPGYPDGDTSIAPTGADFEAQMTQYTDIDGFTNAIRTDRFKYGPYFRKIPENPMNTLNTVQIIPDDGAIPAGDDSDGWLFRPDDAILYADAAGTDSKGVNYSDY